LFVEFFHLGRNTFTAKGEIQVNGFSGGSYLPHPLLVFFT